MTESEWLNCADPIAMFAHLGESPGWRKRQLFSLACWNAARKRIEEVGDDYAIRGLAHLNATVEVNWFSEDMVDDNDTQDALTDVEGAYSNRFWDRIVGGDGEFYDAYHSGMEARLTTWDDPGCIEAGSAFVFASESLYEGWVSSLGASNIDAKARELATRIEANALAAGSEPLACWRRCQARFADLVREVFGNPFRQVVVDPAWLAWGDRIVERLASEAYETQTFENLPILADALEDAGCTDDQIVEHCRQSGEHVRGCWVIDALLGKR